MRNFLLAAVAAVAIASPAAARDGSGYVGVELGGMLAEDSKLDFDDGLINVNNAVAVDYNTGIDGDIIAGYDFGLIRAEGELGYKHAGVNEVVLNSPFCTTVDNCIADASGRSNVLSAMANLLFDFGDDKGVLVRCRFLSKTCII